MAGRLEELGMFVAVVHKRSFVRAADQLGVGVSAVSRGIAGLEARLGVRLLQRTTRSVGLTEAGSAYFERCEALLSELAAAEAQASSLGAEPTGHLRISAATGFGMVVIVPLLPAFLARHPRLRIDLDLSNRYVDLVEERFDLAIRVGTLADSRLAARRLGPNRRILAASEAYLAQYGTPRTPGALAGHACLILDVGARAERWQLARRGVTQAVDVQGPLRSNNAIALTEACLGGAGIALLPQFVLRDPLANGRLQPVLEGWSTEEQGVFAIYPGHRFIPAKVATFVDFLAARMAGHGPR